MTRIHTLMRHDTRILAQPPSKLAVADIDRIDFPRAVRQEYVGEAARGSTDIQARAARGIDSKMLQRVGKLETAARNPPEVPTAKCERGVGG